MAKQLRELVDAGKLPVGSKLVRRVHGKIVARATVLEDGLRVGKKTYPSPSSAAASVTGHNMNGWAWWETEKSGRLLDDLRTAKPAAKAAEKKPARKRVAKKA